jgi:SAM-dependent methyltransferase
MNLLRAMEIAPKGRVLEGGSGPGWVSELLMLLGYEVVGIEPCEDLAKLARERIESARRHFHVEDGPEVDFRIDTLESVSLAPESIDAVLFHDALHHILDEEASIGTCYRALKPGGVLGVSEDAWRPGNRQQESALEEEIRRFGTHESPFTQEYLDGLLTRHGFLEIERYHSVNGFFPAEMGAMSIESAASSPASRSNNLTARKPSFTGPTTMDSERRTRARIEIVDEILDARDGRLGLKLRLENSGETVWLHRPRKAGRVSIALRTEPLGAGDALEAEPRHRLPRSVLPGEAMALTLDFFLPEGYERRRWRLDLVNEGLFWFSERGTEPARPSRL